MNLTAKLEQPSTKQRISYAGRCANAIDQIEPNEDWWDEDEVTRLVQFNGMIAADEFGFGDD